MRKVGIAPHPDDLKQKILDLIDDVTKAVPCISRLCGPDADWHCGLQVTSSIMSIEYEVRML